MEGGLSGPSATQLELNTTFVGSSKEHLDQVDADLRVCEVIGTFGPYAKFLVEEIGGNNMKQLRAAAAKQPAIVDAVIDSMSSVKILISDTIRRLALKGKSFEVFPAGSEQEIEDMWNSLHSIDSTLKVGDKHQKGSQSLRPSLSKFLSQPKHYSFCVKKCGSTSCDICKPRRLPSEVFSKTHHLPDPIPAADGHYKSFSDTYGTSTTEMHRPSLAKRPGRAKTLPFVARVQHVRNVSLMVQCEECEMWRLLYSPRKLSSLARQELSTILDDFTYNNDVTSIHNTTLPPP